MSSSGQATASSSTSRRRTGNEWVSRFDTAMRALPVRQRSESVLAVLDIYRQPGRAVAGSLVPGKHFQAAVERLGLQIPHVTAELITKYLSDMKQAGLL
jgi:fatty acid CoA ligase FadD9